MTKNLLLLTCATGALGLMAGAGHAATATATSQNATNVTEIVVTAEKREQSLQKVPVAVSVFTGAQRDTIGINTVADVTNFAPGFSYDPANVHAYIRGVGRQSVNVTDDQRVANYEDEFYVYSPYGLDKSSLFLSQVQIERGPQSVGGRNAAAGSIDMISVRPTDEPYAEGRVEFGNFGTWNIEGAVSGQVAPGLDMRIAGFDKNQDLGYYKNLIGADEGNVIHEWYVEGQLDWKPNDKFELWMRTFYEAWNGRGDAGSRTGFYNGSWNETTQTDGNAYVGGGLFVNPNFGYAAPNGNPTANAALAAHNAANLTTPAGIAFLAAHPGLGAFFPGNDPIPTSVTLVNPTILNNPAAVNHNTFASQNPRNVKLNNYDDFNYIATYHAANFDIKYNGGFQGYNYYLNDPGDGPASDSNVASYTLPSLPIPGLVPLTIHPQIQANYVEDDFWTAHDITFQSTNDSPFQWTAGGFFFYQQYNQPYTVFDNNQPQLSQPASAGLPCGAGPAAGLCAPNPNNYILYLDYNFTVESEAGYGQASYKFNDQWKISGNIRYNFDNKFGTETSRYIDFAPDTAVAATGGLPFYSVLGANTPSLDITSVLTCPTGTPATAANPNACNTGPLAPGVKSKGVLLPNGFIQRQLGISSDAFTGGGEIEWTPTPDIFTYARYGRGYESPSFNAGQNIALPAVKPEYLNAYEIGYKQSFGKNLLIDIAAYYYDYDGLQVPLSINNGGVTQALFVNVPKSVSEGVEFEAYWTPIHDLVISGSYSYDHTSIQTGCFGSLAAGSLVAAPNSLCVEDTNDPAAVQPGANPFPGQTTAVKLQSVKGNPLPDAPQNKLAVAVAYTWHFEPGDFVLSGDYAFRDTQVGTLFNRFYDSAPSWSDLSFRATWKGPHDRYEITGFVKNALDAIQYTVAAGGAGLGGSANAVTPAATGFNMINTFDINPPRTYGIEMRYKFF
jgi:iron complex outermembrane recepter protein